MTFSVIYEKRKQEGEGELRSHSLPLSDYGGEVIVHKVVGAPVKPYGEVGIAKSLPTDTGRG